MKLINLSKPFRHARCHSYALDHKLYQTNKSNTHSVEVTIMFARCLATVSQPQDYLLEQTLALSISTWNEVDCEVHNLAGRYHDALSLAYLLTRVTGLINVAQESLLLTTCVLIHLYHVRDVHFTGKYSKQSALNTSFWQSDLEFFPRING